MHQLSLPEPRLTRGLDFELFKQAQLVPPVSDHCTRLVLLLLLLLLGVVVQ